MRYTATMKMVVRGRIASGWLIPVTYSRIEATLLRCTHSIGALQSRRWSIVIELIPSCSCFGSGMRPSVTRGSVERSRFGRAAWGHVGRWCRGAPTWRRTTSFRSSSASTGCAPGFHVSPCPERICSFGPMVVSGSIRLRPGSFACRPACILRSSRRRGLHVVGWRGIWRRLRSWRLRWAWPICVGVRYGGRR